MLSLVVNVDKTLSPLVEYTTLPSGDGRAATQKDNENGHQSE